MKRVFRQTRTSICPECSRVLPAQHVEDEKGLHLEKTCPEHGRFSARVAADHGWISALQEFAPRSSAPEKPQRPVVKGCPADCGECAGHLQKAAFFLFEVTDTCNLNCPICLGDPKSRGGLVTPAEMEAMVSSVLAHAGPGPFVSLGGGEPTLHPEFFELVRILKAAGLKDIWLYTNGRKIARAPAFAYRLAAENLYVVLQWDGFSDDVYRLLRGRALLDEKKRALENLKASGANLGLCATIVAGVNDHQLGGIYRMFLTDPNIGTLDIATIAYVGQGQGFLPGRNERITAQDVLAALENQTQGGIRVEDFSPVSLSHPECLQIAYLLSVPGGGFVPLKRFMPPEDYKALVLNKALLQVNAELEEPLHDTINRLWASENNDPAKARGLAALRLMTDILFHGTSKLSKEEMKTRSMALVKVVLVHSYMDALNFDVDRSRMCISRTVLPDGRLMPTCAFNVIHRHAAPPSVR